MDNILFLKPKSIKQKMRVGSHYDGGYVVYSPSLYKCDVLITYGVGWNVDFEEHFYSLTKKNVHMFDPTMFSDTYINNKFCIYCLLSLRLRKLYWHVSFRLKWKNKIKKLFKQGIEFHNEGIAPKALYKYDSLNNHKQKYDIKQEIILLKIDIEGNEYSILAQEDFYQNLINVDQFLIEFHDVKNKLREIKEIVSKLKEQCAYEIVHIHGVNDVPGFLLYNNSGDLYVPDVLELTFVKKDSILEEDIIQSAVEYPIKGLDFPTRHDKPDFEAIKFHA